MFEGRCPATEGPAETIDPAVGLRGFQARKLAFGLGIPIDLVNQAAKFMLSLYDAYEKIDASLIEINPFLLTKDNRLIALDAKVNFDDNAMFRHKEFLDLRDLNEEEPLEIEGPGLGAKRYSSNPTLITPDRYLPKTRIRIMADPIDSALWVALHPAFPMFVANSSS